MRNNRQRNVLTHAPANFSQPETSSLLRGEGGGEGKIPATTGGGGAVIKEDPGSLLLGASYGCLFKHGLFEWCNISRCYKNWCFLGKKNCHRNEYSN